MRSHSSGYADNEHEQPDRDREYERAPLYAASDGAAVPATGVATTCSLSGSARTIDGAHDA